MVGTDWPGPSETECIVAARIRDCQTRLLIGCAGSTACVLIAVLTGWTTSAPVFLLTWAAVALAVTYGGAAWLLRAFVDAQPQPLLGVVKVYALATAFVWATAPASQVDGGALAHLFAVAIPLGVGVAWYWMFATVPAAMALVGVTLAGATALRLILVGGEALYPLAALVVFGFAVLFQFARGYGDSLVEAWHDARDRALREAEIRLEAEHAVAGERERYTDLFEHVVEGLFRARLGGAVTSANPAMTRIFGYDNAPQLIEASGGDWRTLLVQPPRGMAIEAELIAKSVAAECECEIFRFDGEARWISISASAMRHYGEGVSFEGRVLDITERKRAERALERQIGWLERAESAADLGHWYWRLHGGDIYWSPQVYRLCGLDPESFLPDADSVLSRYHPDDRDRVIEVLDQAILTQTSFEFEARLVHESSEERIVLVQGDCEFDQSGHLQALLGMIQDVTVNRLSEKALRRSEAFYRAVVEVQSELIFRCLFDGVITFANQAFCGFFGISRDEAIGASLFDTEGGETILPTEIADAVRRTLEHLSTSSPQQTAELCVIAADGSARWLLFTHQALFDERGHLIEYQTVALDITDRKAADSRIEYLAHHDSLTGLPNRVLFRDHLEMAAAQADRSGNKVAVLMLDLDRFKNVNDALGHGAGDRLLTETSERLSDCVRAVDTVSRLGGDEFAIIQADIATGEQAAVLAQRVMQALAKPFDIDGHEIHSGTSIGITVYPDDGRALDQLLKNADMSLYRAKERERGTFDFYSLDLGRQAQERMEIAEGLAHAVEQNQFSLVYQPKFSAADQQIVSVEALIRWNHPTRGTMLPAAFIPIAESTGLILPIGEWVMRAACKQIKQWREADIPPIPLSINISAAQFRDQGLLAKVRDALATEGIAADLLEMEITEAALMRDAAAATERLNELVEIGVGISIDDFGTGYSSLNYLKQFPVRKLKIDRSFVSQIGEHEEDAAIARTITHLGHSLGLKVVGEGVETEAQLKILQKLGCDEVQGYLLGRPMAARDFVQFVNNRRSDVSDATESKSERAGALADH